MVHEINSDCHDENGRDIEDLTDQVQSLIYNWKLEFWSY